MKLLTDYEHVKKHNSETTSTEEDASIPNIRI